MLHSAATRTSRRSDAGTGVLQDRRSPGGRTDASRCTTCRLTDATAAGMRSRPRLWFRPPSTACAVARQARSERTEHGRCGDGAVVRAGTSLHIRPAPATCRLPVEGHRTAPAGRNRSRSCRTWPSVRGHGTRTRCLGTVGIRVERSGRREGSERQLSLQMQGVTPDRTAAALDSGRHSSWRTGSSVEATSGIRRVRRSLASPVPRVSSRKGRAAAVPGEGVRHPDPPWSSRRSGAWPWS